MKTLRPSKPFIGSPLIKAGNYDDYQSYVEDHTQYNKEVSFIFKSFLFVSALNIDGCNICTWYGCCLSNNRS
jgi:hypothetical protein